MMQSRINAAIVQTIIGLAQSLKMQVVAEGIETAEQFEQLRDWGCEFGQGYFLAKPLDAEDAASLIGCDPFPISLEVVGNIENYQIDAL